jgi:site-specific recombinase XerD
VLPPRPQCKNAVWPLLDTPEAIVVAAPTLDRLTVTDAATRYLAGVDRSVRGHTLSPTTAANYRRDLTEFITLAGADTILDDLTSDQIDDIVLAYGDQPDGRYNHPHRVARGEIKRRGPGAQARFRQSVSRLFTEATLSGWVEANPMLRTKVRPRMKGMTNAARKALPQASADALLAVPEARDHDGETHRADMHMGLRDGFLLRLLMEVGPRVSEVSRADRADIEHRGDGTTWMRLLGKGNKERWVPLSPDTVAAYREYLTDERPTPRPRLRRITDESTGMIEQIEVDPVDDADRALVLTWRGLRMQPRDIQYMVERACRALPADVRRAVTPHGLRHTAATLLLTSGAADVKTVQALLGHASIATTGVYLDTVDAALVQAVNDHPVTGRPVRRRA